MSWGEDPARGAGQEPEPAWGRDPPRNQLRPLNLGDVLDGMFRLVHDHWRAYAIGLGVVVVPLVVLSQLIVTLTLGTPPGLAEILQNPELVAEFGVDATPGELMNLTSAPLLSSVIGLFLTPLIYGTAAHIAAVGYRAGAVNPMVSFRAAASRYGALLGATVLQWLAPLVIFMLPTILFVLGVVAGVDAFALIGGLGFIASMVVAIIVVVRLALAIPAVMIERLGPVQALQRSNTLVKGKTGIVFLTFLVIYLITFIIGLVLSFPFALVGGGVGDTAGAVADAVSQTLANLVNYSLLAGAFVLMYFDRRVRNEGFDLTELANELGEREPPSREVGE